MTQRDIARSVNRAASIEMLHWIQGEVVSVSGSTVSTYLEGNRTVAVPVPKLAQVTGLVAGDRVEVLQQGRSVLIIGKVG